MPPLHPQYLTDANGQRIAVQLPMADYEALLGWLEDQEDLAAARETLRRIESGEDVPMTLAELDEYLNRDLAS